ncbi:TAT-binding protein-like protein 7, AAA ATPase [Pestalotiopsis sp. IQ-011]
MLPPLNATGLERSDSFLIEVWVLYGIGMLVFAARFAVRLKTVGIRGFQGDDLFAVLLILFYTGDAVLVDIVYWTGSNVEAARFQRHQTLTDAEIQQYTVGSAGQWAAWFTYPALLWCLKGAMLCFFKRVTMGLWQEKLVYWLMWACGISYCAVLLTVCLSCYPTHLNWQVVPDPGPKCTFRSQNFISIAVLNVLTDMAILAVPLPILWQLRVSIRKKILVGMLICTGVFVIAAAIIRVVLTVGENPSAMNINRWGVRETIIGIIAANIPILSPAFTKTFWRGPSPTRHFSKAGGSFKTISGGGQRTRSTWRTWNGAFGPWGMTETFAESLSTRNHNKDSSAASFHGSDDFMLESTQPIIPPTSHDVVVQTSYHVSSEENDGDLGNPWNLQDAQGLHPEITADHSPV